MVAELDNDCFYAESGVSSTMPVRCSALKKNSYVMLGEKDNGRPCKIIDLVTSKNGKHGHCKIHVIGLDLFTNKKIDTLHPSTSYMNVPVVTKTDYMLAEISDDGFLSLMDDEGNLREDLICPEGSLGESIKEDFHKFQGEADIMCTVLKACGEERVITAKVVTVPMRY